MLIEFNVNACVIVEIYKSSKKMNCLIVDDDPISRKLIGDFVDKTDWLTPIMSCESAIEASKALIEHKIDLILLDVEMPGMSGLELLDSLNQKLEVILITSNQEYALDGFEHGVADFLIKPVEYSRFLKACNKAREKLESVTDDSASFIFVKSGTSYIKITIDDIHYIESMGDYVALHVNGKRHLINITMKETEEKLGEFNFMRIHRSYIINLSNVVEIEDNSVYLKEGKQLSISRSYKKDLMDRLKLF